MTIRTMMLIAAGAVLVSSVLVSQILSAAPNTLNPPAGPVGGTGRTLEQIYNKVEDVQAAVNGIPGGTSGSSNGPWSTVSVEPTANNPTPTEIIPGRIHLHAIIYHHASLKLFDGDSAQAFSWIRFTNTSNPTPHYSQRIEFNVIVENGLRVAPTNVANGASAYTVLYRSLDP